MDQRPPTPRQAADDKLEPRLWPEQLSPDVGPDWELEQLGGASATELQLQDASAAYLAVCTLWDSLPEGRVRELAWEATTTLLDVLVQLRHPS